MVIARQCLEKRHPPEPRCHRKQPVQLRGRFAWRATSASFLFAAGSFLPDRNSIARRGGRMPMVLFRPRFRSGKSSTRVSMPASLQQEREALAEGRTPARARPSAGGGMWGRSTASHLDKLSASVISKYLFPSVVRHGRHSEHDGASTGGSSALQYGTRPTRAGRRPFHLGDHHEPAPERVPETAQPELPARARVEHAVGIRTWAAIRSGRRATRLTTQLLQHEAPGHNERRGRGSVAKRRKPTASRASP